MPTVRIQHAAFIEVPVELPISCPNCHAWFEDVEESNLVVLRLYRMEGKTSLVMGTDDWKERCFEQDDTDDPGAVIGFSCRRCKEPVIFPHIRSWILTGMLNTEAAKLRTLLYDSNVLDPRIKDKVFGGTR